MPHSLTIHPPQTSFHNHNLKQTQSQSFDVLDLDSPGDSSPVAPAYSPITPKVLPALPVTVPNTANTTFVPPDHGGAFSFSMSEEQQQQQQQQQQRMEPQQQEQPERPQFSSPSTPLHPTRDVSQRQSQQAQRPGNPEMTSSPPARYIPAPPLQPFSSTDAPDALALRAAISTLQFQRRKAQDDIQTLARIKALALEEPRKFQTALASGELKEQRPGLGSLQAILDQSDSDSDSESDSVEELKPEDEHVANHPNIQSDQNDSEMQHSIDSTREAKPQRKKSSREETEASAKADSAKPSFPAIPGPQNVVRAPYVNWEKYGIVGGPLDAMHAQQRRWPGSAHTASGSERGREYVTAAPYSPFLDRLDTPSRSEAREGDGSRKDSAAMAMAVTPTGSISEHPMETRSRT